MEIERRRVVAYCRQLEERLRREGTLRVKAGSDYFPAVEAHFRRLEDVKTRVEDSGDILVRM